MRSKQKKSKEKTRKNTPRPKHTTKSTAGRRPRPNSKQHERKHVRRVSLYSLASKDPRVKNRLRRFAPSAVPHTRQEVKEARGGLIREAGRVRSKEKRIKKKKNGNIRPTRNTPRNPQQPGDLVALETAFDKNKSHALAYTLPLPLIPGL